MSGIAANVARQGDVDQMAKQSIDVKEALSTAPAGSEDVMQTYSGMAVQQPGEAFKVWEYKAGPLAPNEVEIKVTHTGLCHTDLHMKDNDWGITTYPLIAGHEVVGTITAKGANVEGLDIGQRVGVGWIRDSCRRCRFCMKGSENLCATGHVPLIVGPGHFGGFQPLMRAPADFTYTLPDSLSSAAAAPLLCAGVTVYSPLRTYINRPGCTVGVLGIGGLGHLAVQYASKMGAQVTAIDIYPNKEDEAKSLGASRFVEFNTAFKECKGAFDVVINCASVEIDFGGMMRLLTHDGVAIQCGIPGAASVMSVSLVDVVAGQRKLTGASVGGRADVKEMLEFSAAAGIEPMVQIMKLSQVNEALELLKAGKPRYRIVLETDI